MYIIDCNKSNLHDFDFIEYLRILLKVAKLNHKTISNYIKHISKT